MCFTINPYKTILVGLLIIFTSCIDKDIYQGNTEDNQSTEYVRYLYPYGNEAQNIVAEITLKTDGEVHSDIIKAEIPVLKYNKSWLCMLTQDDCMHAAYSTTWAAINGKPLSSNYYYNAEQLAAGDLPPDVLYFNKTLGSTDGTGKEVRFAFTTTLAAEWAWMDAEINVNKDFTKNYSRFQKKSGLTWNNVSEMLAYGTGIAFHDVNTEAVNREDSIMKHYELSQQLILNKLSGRGCKTLAEPNGNKTYVAAALNYAPIVIMTAQNTAATGPKVVPLYPFNVQTDLHNGLLQRTFYDSSYDIVSKIESELRKAKEERQALHIGIHGTTVTFAQFLLWLNNTYGKDGDDSVWFPSLEEYYEYNYYRTHGTVTKEISGNTIKLKISLPSGQYFYYPSVTVNLSGIKKEQIKQIDSDNKVTGLSYMDYEDGLMLNIDCRRYLVEHATHFVEKYEAFHSSSNKNDAIYFTGMLKESSQKTELLKRIQ
ncbi:hypothetical protein [uncultured Proteiniphilum sp.]|uniref:hypothetical protein n=1 Tax=uncultured Proteiniphilum sp. TaxID=497637 RepID=UPI0026078ED7|nr:hypothetical protein [uncultured Proteiniphilum sp.]